MRWHARVSKDEVGPDPAAGSPMLRDASQRRRCGAPQHEGEAPPHSITSSARSTRPAGTS
jgi:hypothetical protein